MTGATPGRRSAIRHLWPLLVVLAGVVAGLLWAGIGGHWRRGSALIGASLVLGAGIRMILPARSAGLLQVRSKPFDVLVLALGGLAIMVLAVSLQVGR